MTETLDMRDELWPRATDLIRPIRRVRFDREGEWPEPPPSTGQRKDSPAMLAALEGCARNGAAYRASRFYVRR